MKHSWSEMFSNTGVVKWYSIIFLQDCIFGPLGEILVYLLPLSVTDTISFARFGIGGMEEEIENWGTELNKIEV